jgi:hypothetical protein
MTPATPDNAMPETASAPAARRADAPKLSEGGSRSRSDAGRLAQRKRFASGFALLACCALLATMVGCGGVNAFTGGGFPIGRAALRGKVVRADSPLTTIPNATVTVAITAEGVNTQPLQFVADKDGNFAFPQVPTGRINARLDVTIDPNNADFDTQKLSFIITNGRDESLIASLSPAAFAITQSASLRIMPVSIQIRPQNTVQITAQVLDAQGNALPVSPSLLLDGSIGTIGGDGLFYGTTNGSGAIYALWYNNLVTSGVQVKVDSSLPDNPTPPPPPKIPNPKVDSAGRIPASPSAVTPNTRPAS